MDLANEGILSNSAVKLLVMRDQLEARMAAIRRQEERNLRWFNATSALTIFIQVQALSASSPR